MKEKFLPVGTVVLLKNAEKRLMITGFSMKTENDEKTYDYCGCLYPQGVISTNEVALFDHDQIDKIFSIGYSDEEEKAFKKTLKEVLENNNMETPNLKDSENNQ